MGIHEWSYDNDVSQEARLEVPHADLNKHLMISKWKLNWVLMKNLL